MKTHKQLSVKLTPKQNEVVWCLQNGWVLITDSAIKGAIVGKGRSDSFTIGNGVFWNLVNKGIIHQMIRYPFWYVLTELGETFKTKNPY
jgi:hypothetical protein